MNLSLLVSMAQSAKPLLSAAPTPAALYDLFATRAIPDDGAAPSFAPLPRLAEMEYPLGAVERARSIAEIASDNGAHRPTLMLRERFVDGLLVGSGGGDDGPIHLPPLPCAAGSEETTTTTTTTTTTGKSGVEPESGIQDDQWSSYAVEASVKIACAAIERISDKPISREYRRMANDPWFLFYGKEARAIKRYTTDDCVARAPDADGKRSRPDYEAYDRRIGMRSNGEQGKCDCEEGRLRSLHDDGASDASDLPPPPEKRHRSEGNEHEDDRRVCDRCGARQRPRTHFAARSGALRDAISDTAARAKSASEALIAAAASAAAAFAALSPTPPRRRLASQKFAESVSSAVDASAPASPSLPDCKPPQNPEDFLAMARGTALSGIRWRRASGATSKETLGDRPKDAALFKIKFSMYNKCARAMGVFFSFFPPSLLPFFLPPIPPS
jgi:hypothetical protein